MLSCAVNMSLLASAYAFCHLRLAIIIWHSIELLDAFMSRILYCHVLPSQRGEHSCISQCDIAANRRLVLHNSLVSILGGNLMTVAVRRKMYSIARSVSNRPGVSRSRSGEFEMHTC